MTYTSTKGRSRSAGVLAAHGLQITYRAGTMTEGFNISPDCLPNQVALEPVMHQYSDQRSSLRPNKIIGTRLFVRQGCSYIHACRGRESNIILNSHKLVSRNAKTPRIPVLPALEGLISETDALAEFMSRPASSL